jgi:hypothetical protein
VPFTGQPVPAMAPAAALTFLWAQAAPVLIRPLYLWAFYGPRIPAEVIAPLQTSGWVLAATAAGEASAAAQAGHPRLA